MTSSTVRTDRTLLHIYREQSYQTIEAPGIGTVESWVELVHVQLPLVSFRHIFVFRKDGKVMTSESTLRFRTRSEIADTLSRAQLIVESVRDAPDRPGLEFVFMAHRRYEGGLRVL